MALTTPGPMVASKTPGGPIDDEDSACQMASGHKTSSVFVFSKNEF